MIPTPSPCPDPLLLARAATGESLPQREALLDHASACVPCRSILADLSVTPGPLSPRAEAAVLSALPARRRVWIPLAAAAALLLAVGVFRMRPSPGTGPGSGSLPASAPSASSPFPAPDARGVLEAAADLSLPAGRCGLLTLKAGSLAKPLPDGALLAEGTLLLEAAGEPLRAGDGDAWVTCREGRVLLEAFARSPQASWVRSAEAAESRGRVLVLQGSAELRRADGETLSLRAGMEADLAGGPARSGSAPDWQGESGWERWTGLPVRLREETRILAPDGLSGDFVWEALCRRLDDKAGAGVCFPAGGAGWELPVGSPLNGGLLRLRVESRAGWIRVQAGSLELLRAPAADLALKAGTGPEGCGLRAWGGELEVLEARWKRLR